MSIITVYNASTGKLKRTEYGSGLVKQVVSKQGNLVKPSKALRVQSRLAVATRRELLRGTGV